MKDFAGRVQVPDMATDGAGPLFETTVYPVVRERRSSYHGPLPKPGQTVMGCPICKARAVFAFTQDEGLRCELCGFAISREDAT